MQMLVMFYGPAAECAGCKKMMQPFAEVWGEMILVVKALVKIMVVMPLKHPPTDSRTHLLKSLTYSNHHFLKSLTY